MLHEVKSIGLTENEATIYNTLLEIGPRGLAIICRRTGLHRRVIYDALDRLTKKGLVGYITQNGRRVFQATSPSRLVELIDEEKNKVERELPALLQMFNEMKEKEKEDTQFFIGKEGLKSVFEQQLQDKKELFILGASPLAYELFKYYFLWFDKRRVERKIPVSIIVTTEQAKQFKKIPLSRIKAISAEYTSPLAINVWGDMSAIILWNKEHPLAIVIKNKEMALGFKKHFEFIWKHAK